MNNSDIRIETTGKILEGKQQGWFILIKDDSINTGGYLIFIFNNCDITKSSECFDDWVEDKNTLIEIFKETNWKIQWLEEKTSIP